MNQHIDMTPEGIAARRERVIMLTSQGVSAPTISAILGISKRSVQRHRARAGIAEDAALPLSDAEKARAKALLEDGCSYNEVARTVGRTSHSLKRWFPGYGWPPQEVGRLAAAQRWANYYMQRNSA